MYLLLCVCYYNRALKLYKAKTNRTARRNRKIHNYNQISTSFQQLIEQVDDQKVYRRSEDYQTTLPYQRTDWKGSTVVFIHRQHDYLYKNMKYS